MEDIELKPRYSTREIPGKCIKCLAEEGYRSCLRELLEVEEGNKRLEEKYEAIVSFLRSPELQSLRDESERYLADGEDVRIVLHFGQGKPEYEIKLG